MEEKEYILEWIIKDKTLKRFKNAEYKEFEYGSYILVGNVLFYLSVYPKGYYKENSFDIYLYCDASFHNISKLKIKYTVSISQINYKRTYTKEYTQFPWGNGIPVNDITFQSICKLNYICITYDFEILNIHDNGNNNIEYNLWNKYLIINNNIFNNNSNNTLIWKLNDNQLNEVKKKLKFKEYIKSDIMYIDNIPFYIEIYPKGFTIENNVGIYLYWEGYKLDILKVDLYYRIYIDQIQMNHMQLKTFTKDMIWGGI